MFAIRPITWDELRAELSAAYDRGVLHATIELDDNGTTLEVMSPRLGVMPVPRNLAGCRILIIRPL